MTGRLLALAILSLGTTAISAREFTDAGGRVIDIPDTIAVALPAGHSSVAAEPATGASRTE